MAGERDRAAPDRAVERSDPPRPAAAEAAPAPSAETLAAAAGQAATVADPRYALPANTGRKAAAMLALQRGAGNAYLQRVLDGDAPRMRTVQAKLAVSSPGDTAEVEADRVADTVTHARQHEGTAQAAAGGAPPIAAMPAGAGRAVDEAAAMPSTDGQPLPASTRAAMESRLGAGLADVRVHADGEAGERARGLGALAYTAGSDISFAPGAFQPNTSSGRHLLAHELTHVVQQRGGAVQVARDPDGNKADEQAPADRAPGKLRPALLPVLRGTLTTTDDSGFSAALSNAAIQALGSDATAEEGTEIINRANGVAAMTTPAKETAIGIPASLRAINGLHQSSADGGSKLPASLGLDYLITVLSRDLADHFTGALASSRTHANAANFAQPVTTSRVEFDLRTSADASGNGERLMSLELEGTVQEVARLRAAFEVATDQAERASLGQQLGEASRRALLLNQALEKMPKPGEPGHTELDKQVLAVSGQIAQIRQTAQKEDTTRKSLAQGSGKDEASLLTVKQVGPASPALGPSGIDIKPEEALPATTDSATNSMANDLNRHVKKQQAEVDQLKDKVIPDKPAYTLPEFSAVFRRWFAFYSQMSEDNDPIVKVVKQIMDQSYGLAGMAGLGGPSAVSGAGARTLAMNQAANVLEGRMAGQSGAGGPDFAGQLKGNAPSQAPPKLSGPATNPNVNFNSVQGDPNSPDASKPSAEADSRKALLDKKNAETQTIAALQAAAQQSATKPSTVGGTPLPSVPVAPTTGLKNPQAQQGWTYLVTVPDPNNPDAKIGQEQKTVPPEVAAYLLARQQQTATLTQPHKPEVDGAPAGDQDVRDKGVEGGQGNNAAKYVQGAQNAPPSPAATNLQTGLNDARAKAGVKDGTPKGEQADRIVQTLIVDLERYLNGYFEKQQDVPMRLGAVFAIASIQYGAGDALQAMADPKNIATMFEEALKISLIVAGLNSLGPVGAIAAKAYEAKLATEGISNLAAVVGVATYLRNASQSNSFTRARVWALLSRYAMEDLSQGINNLVGHAVAKSGAADRAMADTVSKSRPNSASELAAMCKPMMDNPKSRQVLLEGVTNRINEIEAQGPSAKEGNAEYDTLISFRDRLHNRPSQGKPASPDAALAGREAEPTEAMNTFAAGRTRTAAERAALQAALPADLAGKVPIIENPTLAGNTVRVAYDNGMLRMEVGPLAEPRDIRFHVETARKFQRYQGITGFVRQLIDRAKTALRITPGYGTQGFEAREEVAKLNRIIAELEQTQKQIDERGDALSKDPNSATGKGDGDAIGLELASLREQLEAHQKNIDSYEPGKGFVAAEGKERAETEGKEPSEAKKKARTDLEIPRESLLAAEKDSPGPGKKTWEIEFLAEVGRETVTWGMWSVKLDPQGKPAEPPTMYLKNEVKVGGEDVTLQLPTGKGENSSFTYFALESSNRMYKKAFGEEPNVLAGSLHEENLLNFQREFAKERDALQRANPTAPPDSFRTEAARRAISQISFGRWRSHEQFGYTQITKLTLGADVETDITGKKEEGPFVDKVPGSVYVEMTRPEGPPNPARK